MSIANSLWGAPRIHSELLKLGIDVGQTSIAKYMVRRRGPPSQGWKTFLRNHADGVAAMADMAHEFLANQMLMSALLGKKAKRYTKPVRELEKALFS
jgi:hypothetical protein